MEKELNFFFNNLIDVARLTKKEYLIYLILIMFFFASKKIPFTNTENSFYNYCEHFPNLTLSHCYVYKTACMFALSEF